jgi:hypothetical protein
MSSGVKSTNSVKEFRRRAVKAKLAKNGFGHLAAYLKEGKIRLVTA